MMAFLNVLSTAGGWRCPKDRIILKLLNDMADTVNGEKHIDSNRRQPFLVKNVARFDNQGDVYYSPDSAFS